MTRKKREPMGFVQKILKLQHAGIIDSEAPNRVIQKTDQIDIDSIIQNLFNIINKPQRPAGSMLFFVMYDIESNKVRNLIAKYLEKKGCTRIQKSIFLADLDHSVFEQIRSDLAEVQGCYENNDSLILVPISTDYLQSMKVIGKSINVDIITKNTNTIFF